MDVSQDPACRVQRRLTQRADCRADSSTELTMKPQPTEAEIQFILDAISEYLTVKVCTLPADIHA